MGVGRARIVFDGLPILLPLIGKDYCSDWGIRKPASVPHLFDGFVPMAVVIGLAFARGAFDTGTNRARGAEKNFLRRPRLRSSAGVNVVGFRFIACVVARHRGLQFANRVTCGRSAGFAGPIRKFASGYPRQLALPDEGRCAIRCDVSKRPKFFSLRQNVTGAIQFSGTKCRKRHDRLG